MSTVQIIDYLILYSVQYFNICLSKNYDISITISHFALNSLMLKWDEVFCLIQ